MKVAATITVKFLTMKEMISGYYIQTQNSSEDVLIIPLEKFRKVFHFNTTILVIGSA